MTVEELALLMRHFLDAQDRYDRLGRTWNYQVQLNEARKRVEDAFKNIPPPESKFKQLNLL